MYDMVADRPGCDPDPEYDPNMCGFTDRDNCIPLNGCGSWSIFPYMIRWEPGHAWRGVNFPCFEDVIASLLIVLLACVDLNSEDSPHKVVIYLFTSCVMPILHIKGKKKRVIFAMVKPSLRYNAVK